MRRLNFFSDQQDNMALTRDQFIELRKQGLTTQQIIDSEKRANQEQKMPEEEKSGLLNFIGDITRGITKPIATSLVRPYQLEERLRTGETPTVKLPFFGEIEPPKDILGAAGTALQTVGIGLGPVAGGAAFGGGAALERGATVPQAGIEAGIGGALGKGFEIAAPIVGKAISKLPELNMILQEGKKDAAARVVDSLIKPLLKDFSYGKQPGRAVAQEGIVANSLDELAGKISETRKNIGSEIKDITTQGTQKGVTADFSRIVDPIDKAIQQAMKAPRVNKEAINRLIDTKADLLGENIDNFGNVVYTRNLSRLNPDEGFELKQIIGDITKFTGNASDDATINKALKQSYGITKETLNTSLSGIKSKAGRGIEELNEKYADLTSAEIATKYRDKIEQRQNLIGLGARITGYGSAILGTITTGNVSPLIVGLSAGALDMALGSPAVKSRVAAWLASESPSQVSKILQKVPQLQAAMQRAGLFGSQVTKKVGEVIEKSPEFLREAPKKKVDFSDVPIGMSIKDVSGNVAKSGNALFQEARKYKTAEEFVKAQTELRLYGKGLDSISKKVNIDSIKPSQVGEDLFNETSQSYAKGGMADNIFTGKPIRLEPIISPETIPPIVVDNKGRIIDGNNRWAASKIAGQKEIRVVTESQLREIWGKAQQTISKQKPYKRGELLRSKTISGEFEVLKDNGLTVDVINPNTGNRATLPKKDLEKKYLQK